MAGGELVQVRTGEFEAGPDQRDAFVADGGLCAGLLAGPQRGIIRPVMAGPEVPAATAARMDAVMAGAVPVAGPSPEGM
jgi:hypothetical protein